ncbi:hypothetical protein [Paucibacter sp. DJ2R-2]|uniref:hypothetical protein n=1 Tax=Paucibacter sp. DJ2R-2 TaxID=2893558 RepID=UPI0021E47906|nr:hypothetical protein [Paucibacter sp. DJ2R-2]MCV2420041.1 hypothetical protein [Paucibacter sp. DJ4R-1]MCV2437032.1 hypothetical protein [Paucibacter sp. DJ2R-2]
MDLLKGLSAALADRETLGLKIYVLANVSLVLHREGAVDQFDLMMRASREIIECFSDIGEADDAMNVCSRIRYQSV